ncbi:hypothetical protein [Cellulophaga omnivescoria]|uniref:hypothetical protein n=1 Tax=Cellulophaga omnivescoria TaxID=1888890 RepID=UPI0022F09E4B|nr:hypothetical protein [Cellulophaga omnivescoria]WBU89764.1 hypothetical protein PBN93_01805 [Cellulophaga omnivescoria]
MKDSKKWKSRLLSSSIPLEYEVAKILSDLDFSVSFDYSYFRKEGERRKEFSTDIKGYFLFPIDSEDKIDASLTLLTECKYRDESKKWVFLPDINKPDFSTFTLGNTIKSLAEFSLKKIDNDLIYEFEEKLDFALKGVEINITSGEVFDKDIRHGISQLKYALPYLIKRDIEANIWGHLVDTNPPYIISILVTNAELYILDDDFSISKIREVDNIEQLAKKVPYLVYNSEIGPDFTEHHKEIFKGFTLNFEEKENLSQFENFQKKHKHKEYNIYESPVNKCWELENSHYSTLKEFYSQHFICSFEYYPKLVNEIIELLSRMTK